MSKRTALLALAAALTVVSTTASASTREVVRYTSEVQPGTIVVKTAERKLYYVLGDGTAIRYAVAVGKPGKQWQGKARVSGKYVQPAWTPPAEVKADNPALPDVIPGGAPNNPMGVAAMTLSGGEYAIRWDRALGFQPRPDHLPAWPCRWVHWSRLGHHGTQAGRSSPA